MLFHSKIYLLIFLPIVILIYFRLNKFTNQNLKKYFLVLAGIIFYSWWKLFFLPIIISSILINYFIANKIKENKKQNKKRGYLILSILFNILLLIIFKYADFVIENINFFSNLNIEKLNIPFPLAISFVTFQTIAFLIDIYDEEIKNFNLLNYSLFIIFFPQLIAGPIVKYQEMIDQFNNKKKIILN